MFDLNGDGEVDYQEFQKVHVYTTHPHIYDACTLILQVEFIIVSNLLPYMQYFLRVYICILQMEISKVFL